MIQTKQQNPSQGLIQPTSPVNGHPRGHFNNHQMQSTQQMEQYRNSGQMPTNTNQNFVSTSQASRETLPVGTTANTVSNVSNVAQNAPHSNPPISTQQNGGWSAPPSNLQYGNPPIPGISSANSAPQTWQPTVATNSLPPPNNINSNTSTTQSSSFNQNANVNQQMQIGMQAKHIGPTPIPMVQQNAATRPLNPTAQNVVPPASNISTSRPPVSSIRQRYPNMMPPPINSTQPPAIQPTLQSNTNPSVQPNYGLGTAQRFPTSTATPHGHPTSAPGFPPPHTSNQAIGGRPSNILPPPGTATSSIAQRIGGLSLSQGGDAIDLLQNRHILPTRGTKVPVPKPRLQAELWNTYNCSTDIFRSTLTRVRSSNKTYMILSTLKLSLSETLSTEYSLINFRSQKLKIC